MKNLTIELSKSKSVNFLWTDFINSFGFDKAKSIINQAIDLQRMNGKVKNTMPIVFTGTGGLALISIDLFKNNNFLLNKKGDQVLIYNSKEKLFQILYEAT